MTKPRTHEEIGRGLEDRLRRFMHSEAWADARTDIDASLREAADVRDAEWRAALDAELGHVYVIVPKDYVGALKAVVRREEREALLEVIAAQQDLLVAHRLGSHQRADKALTRLENARLKAGLDARSRAEESR